VTETLDHLIDNLSPTEADIHVVCEEQEYLACMQEMQLTKLYELSNRKLGIRMTLEVFAIG